MGTAYYKLPVEKSGPQGLLRSDRTLSNQTPTQLTVDKWEPILFANVVALVPENPITQQGDQRQGPPQALIDLSQCARRARSLSQPISANLSTEHIPGD